LETRRRLSIENWRSRAAKALVDGHWQRVTHRSADIPNWMSRWDMSFRRYIGEQLRLVPKYPRHRRHLTTTIGEPCSPLNGKAFEQTDGILSISNALQWYIRQKFQSELFLREADIGAGSKSMCVVAINSCQTTAACSVHGLPEWINPAQFSE
jgi:hypothetical protein